MRRVPVHLLLHAAFLAALLAGLLASTRLLRQVNPWLFVTLRLVLVLAVLLLIARVALLFLVRQPGLAARTRNLGLLVLSLLGGFLVLEAVFTVPRSSYVSTLSSRLWLDFYWNPINALGYRDADPAPAGEGVRHIAVVGDSHTAGYGIERIADRFPDRLQRHLGRRSRVYNVAIPGATLRQKLSRLKSYPVQPDVVVLQYLVDDIHAYALQPGEEYLGFRPYSDVSTLLRPLLSHSFLLNDLYWRLPRPEVVSRDYASFVELYQRPEILDQHHRDLDRFVGFCKKRSILLVVVIFPFLHDLELSAPMCDPVREHLQARGVSVISVSDLVRGMPVRERLVSSIDPHPSRKVHRLVAEVVTRELDRSSANSASIRRAP